jgi:hypothetical protein
VGGECLEGSSSVVTGWEMIGGEPEDRGKSR